jgi:hypothetical protein
VIGRINGKLVPLQMFSGSDQVVVVAAARTVVRYKTLDVCFVGILVRKNVKKR